jgi:dCTP deaminase
MILSGKEIFKRKIFTPFHERSLHEKSGMTYGVSYAGYDIRLAQDIVLDPMAFELGSSVEHFDMPNDCFGFVTDKSSLIRQGVCVGRGTVEPGWRGWLTLEISNLTHTPRFLVSGQPIAQIVIQKIENPCEQGYSGKYQDQENCPVFFRNGGQHGPESRRRI